jgi:hypothetical protein
VHRLPLPEEDVEDDELGRDLGRKLAHAALGRVEAHLQGVEVERAAALDDDLAVECRAGRELLPEVAELGKVA